MFYNTHQYRPLAIHYTKYGHYPFQLEYDEKEYALNKDKKKTDPYVLPTLQMMSEEAQEFAKKWIDIFVNGYEDEDGLVMPGEYMFYLNCVQMELVKSVAKGRGKRAVDFPSFWDEDFRYFFSCEIAKKGVDEHYYKWVKNNYCDIHLEETIQNFEGGLNHLWLKPRGVGASWKGGTFLNYHLYLTPDTHNFIIADKEAYLGDKDGAFKKFISIRNFIQNKIWFLRKSFSTQQKDNKSFQTGQVIKLPDSTINVGFNSSVSGIVVDGDSSKVRGMRGNGLFEEFGSFPNVAKCWEVFESGLKEDDTVFGQARGFGTGGDSADGFKDLEKMFRDPDPYRLIRFNNVYEKLNFNRPIAMFTPAYINITFKDADGNSNIEAGREYYQSIRDTKDKAVDKTTGLSHRAEKPFEPHEAFISAAGNIFSVELAKEQRDRIKASGLDKLMIRAGWFHPSTRGLKFVVDPNASPFIDYPVERGQKKKSAVCIVTPPYKNNLGLTPPNLYYIAVDPYSHAETADGDSIGSIYVLENMNSVTGSLGDRIVAWYNGRPEGHDGQNEFAKQAYYLAEYYSAMIGIENNTPGELISYGKLHTDSYGRKLTYTYLAEQFELAYDEKVKTKTTMNRSYGMHIEGIRKAEGIRNFADWLERPRKRKADGTMIYNINTIYDLGLLEEIIQFNGNNADRISAMIISTFFSRELQYKKHTTGNKVIDMYLQSLSAF